MLTTTLAALAVPLFALAAANPTPPVDPGLTLLVAELDRAWNTHDADVHLGLFTEDGTLLTPSGKRGEGKAQIRALVGGKGPTGQTTSQTTIEGVQQLAPGLVLIDATQKLAGPGTKIMGSDTARVVLVARKVGDVWKAVSVRPFPQPMTSSRSAKR